MIPILILFAFVVLLLTAAVRIHHRSRLPVALNNNPADKAWRKRSITLTAAVDLTGKRFYLQKYGADRYHCTTVTLASDRPLGPCWNDPQSGFETPILLGGTVDTTSPLIAGGSFSAGDSLYSDGTGKVINEAAIKALGAGTYWRVGRAITEATASGDNVEATLCDPVQVIVIAAPTIGASVVTTASTSTTPFGYVTQAQADALVARVNQLLVDVGALQAAMATRAEVIHL